jgi:hypothetical protein
MEDQKQEKRRAIRIKKELMAQYKDEARIYKWNMSSVKDFSELGMFITTEEFFPVNTILKLRLKLPSNPFEYLRLKGRVVACEKRGDQDSVQLGVAGYSTKIEFLDMKPEQQESIRAYINWFLSRGGQGK